MQQIEYSINASFNVFDHVVSFKRKPSQLASKYIRYCWNVFKFYLSLVLHMLLLVLDCMLDHLQVQMRSYNHIYLVHIWTHNSTHTLRTPSQDYICLTEGEAHKTKTNITKTCLAMIYLRFWFTAYANKLSTETLCHTYYLETVWKHNAIPLDLNAMIFKCNHI